MKDKLVNDLMQGLLMAAVVAVALPMPDMAWAQSLGTSVTQVTSNELNPFTSLVSGLFYIAGGVLIGAGALKLKQHAENPSQTPLGHGLGRIGAGAALMAIPYFGGMAVNTLHLGSDVAPFAQFNTISAQ